MQYRQLRIISGRGSRPDQFKDALRGICVDGADLVYSVGDQEVKVFESTGQLKRHWQTAKPGYCIAIDQQSCVYVGQVGQIEKFDSTGKPLATWQDGDKLGLVTAIGFTDKYVLVADAKDRCIRRYDRIGKWLNDIGKDNNTRGFLIPNGHLDFSVDAQGVIHTANPAKHRVERYSLEGKLLGYFGRFGQRRPEDFPGCCNPTNLTLNKNGHVIVTEKASPRLKVYDSAGKLLSLISEKAFDAGCKNMDVATDSHGRIYVVDTVSMHICVFAPVSAESKPMSTTVSSPQKGTGEHE